MGIPKGEERYTENIFLENDSEFPQINVRHQTTGSGNVFN